MPERDGRPIDETFWLDKWRSGAIGFHRSSPLPLLTQHWDALDLPSHARVLVPLCGKSLDMVWLAEQGYRVLGVELSPLAIGQFFAEHDLHPTQRTAADGTHYVTDAIEIINADVLTLDATTLASCAAVYDRAAIVALPPPLRTRYVHEVYGRLPTRCQGLMITLEYNQQEMPGPPFAVNQAMLETLFEDGWSTTPVERRDILHSEPGLRARGLGALHTGVYHLVRRGD